MRVLPVAAVLALVLQACGTSPGPGGSGNGPDGGGPGPASLTVTPTSPRVLAGSGAIAIQATLVGDATPITWSLSGPGTLGASTGEQTTYTPPASVDAETVATVTASAGAALSAGVQITVVPSAAMDVTGRVVGPTGVGLSGLSVGIGTKTALTGSDGRFSIAGVVPPYDVNVVLSGDRIRAGRYEGLTRADPTLPFLWLFTTGEPNTATIAGTVSGGQPVGAAGEFTAAFFTTSDVRFDFSAIGVTARNNPFTLPISWFGQESITGTLHVLQFQAPRVGAPPTAFTGYGTHAGVAVSRDGAVEGADVVLAAPGNVSIGGTALPPDGYTVDTKFLNLEVAALTSVPLGHVDGADTGFTFTVPEGIPATAAVTVSAVRAGVGTTTRRVAGIAPGTTGVSVALPAPALPVGPADAAHGPTGDTLFTWAPLQHAVHLVVVDSGDAVPSLFVLTAGTSTRVPLLSSGTTYQWYVGAFGPFDSLDDFTGGANLFPALGDSFQTVSAIRTFVAQ